MKKHIRFTVAFSIILLAGVIITLTLTLTPTPTLTLTPALTRTRTLHPKP